MNIQFRSHTNPQPQVLPTYCICSQPYNPDSLIIACPSPTCAIWLHPDCLVDSVLSAVYETRILPDGDASRKKRRTSKARKVYDGILEGEYVPGERGSLHAHVRVTDLREGIRADMRSSREPMVCLRCGEKIE
jgi:hypothetical protein